MRFILQTSDQSSAFPTTLLYKNTQTESGSNFCLMWNILSCFWRRFSTYLHKPHSFAYKKPMCFTYHTWNFKSFGLWWPKWHGSFFTLSKPGLMSFLHFFLQRDHIIIIYISIFFFFFLQRRHLLDNLDDKPANETERALVKNKSAFPIIFLF